MVPPRLSTESFPPLAPLQFPLRSVPVPAKPVAMDDLTASPILESVVLSATGEIERNRERFSARSLVAWQVGAQEGKVEISTFTDDVRSTFRIRRVDIQFTKFHPEDFFITCSNQRVTAMQFSISQDFLLPQAGCISSVPGMRACMVLRRGFTIVLASASKEFPCMLALRKNSHACSH